MYNAKVLADSLSPDGFRITTFQVVIPRIVLAEFNTHRRASRNSASSRAIPVKDMLEKVENNPFIPTYWGKNQKGMAAFEEFEGPEATRLSDLWITASKMATLVTKELMARGVHKQLANRLLEPWLWQTIICTGTEWENYINLRTEGTAQPEIQIPSRLMVEARLASTPKLLGYGEWHLPLVRDVDLETLLQEGYSTWEIAQISAGRCARVSYLTHDGKRDPKADIAMCAERLVPAGHMSPLEHCARPMYPDEMELVKMPVMHPVQDAERGMVLTAGSTSSYYCGNVEGWVQMRKLVPGEAIFTKMIES